MSRRMKPMPMNPTKEPMKRLFTDLM